MLARAPDAVPAHGDRQPGEAVTQALPGIGGVSAATATAPAAGTAKTNGEKAAEGFEKLLLGQLTKVLVDSALPDDKTASAATAVYRESLPDALTEALMSGGGIGLAKQLEEGMR